MVALEEDTNNIHDNSSLWMILPSSGCVRNSRPLCISESGRTCLKPPRLGTYGYMTHTGERRVRVASYVTFRTSRRRRSNESCNMHFDGNSMMLGSDRACDGLPALLIQCSLLPPSSTPIPSSKTWMYASETRQNLPHSRLAVGQPEAHASTHYA